MKIMLLCTLLSNESVIFNLAPPHIEMDYKDGSFLGGMLDFLEKQHFQFHKTLVNSCFKKKHI